MGISIGRNGIFVKLLPAALYLLKVDTEVINRLTYVTLYITVNQKALKYWYKVTGYIGEQNIKLLPETVTGIDLSSLPDLLKDYNYIVYAEIRIKLKPSKGHIEPGIYQNELIYSDFIGPIKGIKADYKWVVTFTKDITKVVYMALLPDSSYETVL